jgi:hypothetical protein
MMKNRIRLSKYSLGISIRSQGVGAWSNGKSELMTEN